MIVEKDKEVKHIDTAPVEEEFGCCVVHELTVVVEGLQCSKCTYAFYWV